MSRKYLARALSLAVAPVAVLGLMSGPASAEVEFPRVCRGGNNPICLTIARLDTGNYRVTIGIEYHTSKADAERLIRASSNGHPYVARIYGSDGSSESKKTPLFSVPEVNLSASDEFGLSADFVRVVPPSWLDEDRGSAEDDVFARVQLTDEQPEPNLIYTFDTPEINESF